MEASAERLDFLYRSRDEVVFHPDWHINEVAKLLISTGIILQVTQNDRLFLQREGYPLGHAQVWRAPSRCGGGDL